MIPPVLIVYHVWKGASRWPQWASEQLVRIAKADIPAPVLISSAQREIDTINRLVLLLPDLQDGAVLYLHQKGITWDHPAVADHREMMEYFCIDQWRPAVEFLTGHDAVGCDLEPVDGYGPESQHFAGNFWWARTSYLKRLRPILKDAVKGMAEGWIASGQGRLGSLHQSRVNHYHDPYPPERYR